MSGAVTDVAYSPNGSYVVTADANRKVTLFDAEYEKANAREWGFHTAKVNRVVRKYSPRRTNLVITYKLNISVIPLRIGKFAT